MHNHYATILLAVLVMAGGTGCGSSGGLKEYPVTGAVKFDGQPVESGQILFRAAQGGRGYSGAIANGVYQLKAEAGKMSVQITASRIIPGKFDETSNPGMKTPIGEMYIPARYNTKTELTAEVKAGTNSIDFDLKSEAQNK